MRIDALWHARHEVRDRPHVIGRERTDGGNQLPFDARSVPGGEALKLRQQVSVVLTADRRNGTLCVSLAERPVALGATLIVNGAAESQLMPVAVFAERVGRLRGKVRAQIAQGLRADDFSQDLVHLRAIPLETDKLGQLIQKIETLLPGQPREFTGARAGPRDEWQRLQKRSNRSDP